jgi:hypothetical protein
MNTRRLLITAAALLIGIVAFNIGSQAQGPLWDKVIVNLPYSVTVGDRTIEPGEYSIKQLSSPGGASRVLLIYKDDMKFETSAMTIPALDNNTPEDTKVMLHHIGNDYYFDKIWIQGKNYGYEFILPDAVKARQRERMEPVNVAARYEAIPAESGQVESAQTTTSSETTSSETRTRVESESTVAQAAPAPVQEAPAQEAPPAREEVAAAPVQEAPAAPEARHEEVSTADRSVAQDTTADRSMPDTSANWLMLLLAGGALSGAGLVLRRR